MKRFHLTLGVADVEASPPSGMLWERVTADRQAAEIRQTWLSTSYQPTLSSEVRPRPSCMRGVPCLGLS